MSWTALFNSSTRAVFPGINVATFAIALLKSTANLNAAAAAPAIGNVRPVNICPPMRCMLPPTLRIFLPKRLTFLAASFSELLKVSRSLSVAKSVPTETLAAISRHPRQTIPA